MDSPPHMARAGATVEFARIEALAHDLFAEALTVSKAHSVEGREAQTALNFCIVAAAHASGLDGHTEIAEAVGVAIGTFLANATADGCRQFIGALIEQAQVTRREVIESGGPPPPPTRN